MPDLCSKGDQEADPVNNALLIVMNPRYLPECLLSIEQIRHPKVWLRNYTEKQLETVIPQVIAETSHDFYVVVSDDCIVSQNALDEVIRHLENKPVVTGFCNLDPVSEFCSITKTPPRKPYATRETYDWMTLTEAYETRDELIRTYHPSFALTGMSRDMWGRFPWRCWPGSGDAGWAADLDMSVRLRNENVPIYSPKKAFIWHTKPVWELSDSVMHARRALRVGTQPAEISYDAAP